jgi:hypothetical protein
MASTEPRPNRGGFEWSALRSLAPHLWPDSNLAIRMRLEAKLDGKVDGLDAKFDAKFAALDAKFDSKFEALDAESDAKFDALDAKFDAKFDGLKKDVAAIAESISKAKIWAIGLNCALAASLLGTLARALGWI